MHPPTPPRASALLDWDADGQPLSRRFGDVYFSRANGLEESRYVFLHHNGLPQRWQTSADTPFTIAETGFGTGLNFLATWHSWRRHAPPGARLHYVSAEKYPLSLADLTRALALWPELAPLSAALAAAYPRHRDGFHRLLFEQGRVVLSLLIGDAGQCFDALDAGVDAWFLDGFAPAKNPAMWSPALFAAMRRLSHPGTTFATFSAAALVRQGLAEAGFSVTKVAGFGRKRHMLCGQLAQPAPQPASWQQRPPRQAAQEAIVIGAGLAGASTARALAERGIRVTLLERGGQPGCEGSGNPQGVLYLKLPTQPTPQGRIHLTGYAHTLSRLQQLALDATSWQRCGVLQLPPDAAEAGRQQKLLASGHYPDTLVQSLSQREASARAGVALPSGGLWFPDGGWVAPARLCARLLEHPLITTRFNTEVAQIQSVAARWQALDRQQQPLASAALMVVACAASSARFTPLAWLPLKAIRGQISSGDATAAPALSTVLCGNGYVSPPLAGRYCFGASFGLGDPRRELLADDHRANLAHLEALCPSLASALAPQLEQFGGRVGFRCASPDYLPLAGPVPDRAPFIARYAALRHDASAIPEAAAPLLPGLFVNLAHGSKGLLTAPLCAELVAACVDGSPLPLERALLGYLLPARFLIKDLKRRAI